ncbi:MAG: TonB-dependent receptor [Deltaproteobacteria bacterium]|nr:TonB-dependent receptor [Deltaproteobacteria bacterium]
MCTIFLFSSSGFAEVEQQKPLGESHDDFILEETVITATKTGETRLQETPLTVSALSGENLKNSSIFRTKDLSLWVPNAEFNHGLGYTQGFIRGVGNAVIGTLGGETNIAYYVDGVYLEQGLGAVADFMDVARIEILRGPQGTLYGRNANGGAMNIITKAPSDELSFGISAEYGSYNKYRLDTSISGPVIKDKVKVRLSGATSRRDGYFDNKVGPDLHDEDFESFRGKVQITPADGVDILLAGDYYKADSLGPTFKLFNDQGVYGFVFGATTEPGFWDARLDTDNFYESELSGVSATVGIELPRNMLLKSITAYRQADNASAWDVDGTELALADQMIFQENDQFTQEVQLQGNWNRWNWVVGAFYHHQESDSGLSTLMDYIGPLIGLPIPPGQRLIMDTMLETDAYAFFGNVRFRINDQLFAEAGLRYSNESKDALHKQFGVPFNLLPPADLDFSKSWDAVTPRFAIDYRVTEDVLVYVSVARGFRPGTFGLTNPAPPYDVNPEFIWNYELGAKTQWLNNRLRANAAIFYSAYEDMQIARYVGSTGFLENASEATIQGVELELLARPLSALTLNGTLSYLDATFDELLTDDNLTFESNRDLSGNQLAFVPEWKLSFGAQYILTLGERGFLTVRGDVSWKDTIYFDQFNREFLKQDPATVLNALVRFETPEGRWSAEVYGRNLTEEETLSTAFALLSANDTVGQVGEPAMFGIKVAFNY